MRILHVNGCLSAEIGGPSEAVVSYARVMARRGHQVRLQAVDDGTPMVDMEGAQDDGVQLEICPLSRPAWLTRNRQISKVLGQKLAEAIPESDLVHIHGLTLYHTWKASQLCQRLGVPYILRPLGTLDPYIRRQRRAFKWVMGQVFQNNAFKKARAFHFTSKEEQLLAAPAIFNRPYVIVPNPVDTSRFSTPASPAALLDNYPQLQGKRLILFMSRLSVKKGLNLLVPAFAKAVKTCPDLHLVIAGSDHGVEARTRAAVKQHQLSDQVTFTGHLSGEMKRAALTASNLFVLPSYTENFGIALVEAMAAGLPVLTSPHVNIWREIEEDGAAMIVPQDIIQISTALIKLMQNSDRLTRMSKAGPSSAHNRYSLDQVGAQLEAAYEGLLR